MPLEELKSKPGWLWRQLAQTKQASKELDAWLKAHPEAQTSRTDFNRRRY